MQLAFPGCLDHCSGAKEIGGGRTPSDKSFICTQMILAATERKGARYGMQWIYRQIHQSVSHAVFRFFIYLRLFSNQKEILAFEWKALYS
jgi:hypothetical protein